MVVLVRMLAGVLALIAFAESTALGYGRLVSSLVALGVFGGGYALGWVVMRRFSAPVRVEPSGPPLHRRKPAADRRARSARRRVLRTGTDDPPSKPE